MAISPSAVTGVVRRTPLGGSSERVLLRAHALTPEAAARSGVMGWQMPLEVDCRAGKVRLGPTTGFRTRQATGDGVPLTAAEPGWRTPLARTQLASVWRAVCDPGFQSPLGAAGARLAQTPTPVRSALQAARDAVAVEATPQPTAKPARPAAARPGGAAVQVISSPDTAETNARLTQLRGQFPQEMAALGARIQTAQVNGRIYHRGLIVGFPSRREAVAFCDKLKAAGQDCLPR